MSTQMMETNSRPIRCCLCSWMTYEPNSQVREQQWREHYYGLHPQPLVTTCIVPPYCGWTSTAPDLDTLRLVREAHEAMHATQTPEARYSRA